MHFYHTVYSKSYLSFVFAHILTISYNSKWFLNLLSSRSPTQPSMVAKQANSPGGDGRMPRACAYVVWSEELRNHEETEAQGEPIATREESEISSD